MYFVRLWAACGHVAVTPASAAWLYARFYLDFCLYFYSSVTAFAPWHLMADSVAVFPVYSCRQLSKSPNLQSFLTLCRQHRRRFTDVRCAVHEDYKTNSVFKPVWLWDIVTCNATIVALWFWHEQDMLPLPFPHIELCTFSLYMQPLGKYFKSVGNILSLSTSVRYSVQHYIQSLTYAQCCSCFL